MKNKKIEIGLHYIILLLLVYLVVFLKLGDFHMRWWDESMFAVNTYEMIHNGKWFSLYFNNAPDLFNTKPPLTIWFQVLFVKLIGYNELAVRLPSGIAAGVTVMVLFRFLSLQFNYFYAWISSMILLTSYGFLNFHTGRTADSDALLTVFVFVANIFFLRYILNQKRKDILYFMVFITLAFLTKLYAALLFAPAYLFILYNRKLLKEFVWNKSFLLGVLIFTISIGSITYLRELDTPGYLHEVIYKDAGRLGTVIENHKESTFYYLDNFINYRYSIWFVWFVLGAILTLSISSKRKRIILQSFLLFIGVYLLIITVSVTKLEWYDMPLFPYLAAISAYPLYWILDQVKWNQTDLKVYYKYLILALIFFYPYSIMFDKAQGNTIPNGVRGLEASELFLFQKMKSSQNMDGLKVYYSEWDGSLLFYKYRLKERNQGIELVRSLESFKMGDSVLVSDEKLKDKLRQKFNTSVLDSKYNAELMVLTLKE